MTLQAELDAIFDAERALRKAEAGLLSGQAGAVAELLAAAVENACALKDVAEAELRLTRLADLCAQVSGPRMSDALVRILDHDLPAVRVQAAEALVDVAYDRYAEVARAIERTLDSGKQTTALRELPWVIAEVAEPSALPLLRRFLAHADAEVVASAIEALSSLGDSAAVPALQKLTSDARMVTLDDGDDEVTASVGDLAAEAIELLRN